MNASSRWRNPAMCGIAGLITSDPLEPDELEARARRMADAIAHRGPDDHGVWVQADPAVALAHRRLSIIDLSAEGRQPMRSASGRFVVTYNGEIYNYVEVRQALERETGALPWRGHSDTEVMLAAFEHWGVADTLERCNGMFALAAWDRQARVLHLARDRMGEKPLYYGRIGRTFAFASELKALRTLPGFDAPVDREALALFLRFNYVPAPWSIYRGIAKLPPGNRAEVRADASGSFDVRVVPYWDVAAVAHRAMAQPIDADEPAALDGLHAELERSVRLRMVGDVPVGAFLSGGIDSSIVTALMQAQSSRPVRTFTIGFTEDGFDEAPYAAAVARHLGTDHTELYLSGEQTRDVVPLLPSMYDEPFADSSQIPTFLVSRLARHGVTVALSGDGGDELFFGYQRYVQASEPERVPRAVREAAGRALAAVPPALADTLYRVAQPILPGRWHIGAAAETVRSVADALRVDPRRRYVAMMSLWQSRPPVRDAGDVVAPHDRLAAEDRELPLGAWMMLLDQRTYLPDDILAKVDRASMAVALEARVPLLDPQLVRYAWSLPLSLKLRDGRGKHLLRRVLERFVPAELVDRPKRGFAVPLGEWLRGPLRPWAEALLDESRLRREGFLDVARVRERWQRHLAGARWGQDELWGVLTFQAWLERAGLR